MVNNYDWTASLSTIDFLRDIGKHFPVNRMLARDIVRKPARGRHLLHRVQLRAAAVDGLPQPPPRPRRHAAVRGQRPVGQHHRRGRADPAHRGRPRHTRSRRRCITRSDGTKYGKTEGGALWLDPEMLSPYAFYQFWLNAEDAKVRRAAAGVHLPRRARRSRSSRRRRRRSRSCAPGRRPWPSTSRPSVHGGRRPSASRPRPPPSSAAATCAPRRLDPRGCPARGRLGPGEAARRCRRSSTCWCQPACPRQGRGPPDGLRRAAPTSTTSASPTPISRPGEHDLLGGRWLVLRRGKKNLAGVEVVGESPAVHRRADLPTQEPTMPCADS